eukprot:gene20332-24393_t
MRFFAVKRSSNNFATQKGLRIFSSAPIEGDSKETRTYQAGTAKLVFEVRKIVRGDILVVFTHITPFYRAEQIARFNFHTGMFTMPTLIVGKSELDGADGDKRFLNDFYFRLDFEEPMNPPAAAQAAMYQKEIKKEIKYVMHNGGPDKTRRVARNGSLFFMPKNASEKIKAAHDVASRQGAAGVHSGYLIKKGHNFKSWRKRWFVLKDNVLSYYKSPKDTAPAGSVPVSDIEDVTNVEDPQLREGYAHCFQLRTNKVAYLIAADNERDLDEWIEMIRSAKKMVQESGRLFIEILDVNYSMPSSIGGGRSPSANDVDLITYLTLSLGKKKDITSYESAKFNPNFQYAGDFIVYDQPSDLVIGLWFRSSVMDIKDTLVAELVIPYSMLSHSFPTEFKPFNQIYHETMKLHDSMGADESLFIENLEQQLDEANNDFHTNEIMDEGEPLTYDSGSALSIISNVKDATKFIEIYQHGQQWFYSKSLVDECARVGCSFAVYKILVSQTSPVSIKPTFKAFVNAVKNDHHDVLWHLFVNFPLVARSRGEWEYKLYAFYTMNARTIKIVHGFSPLTELTSNDQQLVVQTGDISLVNMLLRQGLIKKIKPYIISNYIGFIHISKVTLDTLQYVNDLWVLAGNEPVDIGALKGSLKDKLYQLSMKLFGNNITPDERHPLPPAKGYSAINTGQLVPANDDQLEQVKQIVSGDRKNINELFAYACANGLKEIVVYLNTLVDPLNADYDYLLLALSHSQMNIVYYLLANRPARFVEISPSVAAQSGDLSICQFVIDNLPASPNMDKIYLEMIRVVIFEGWATDLLKHLVQSSSPLKKTPSQYQTVGLNFFKAMISLGLIDMTSKDEVVASAIKAMQVGRVDILKHLVSIWPKVIPLTRDSVIWAIEKGHNPAVLMAYEMKQMVEPRHLLKRHSIQNNPSMLQVVHSINEIELKLKEEM